MNVEIASIKEWPTFEQIYWVYVNRMMQSTKIMCNSCTHTQTQVDRNNFPW